MGQNYKVILQYEGTRYDGWQKQGNTDHTIQGKLEAILARFCGVPVEVHGSGRTDAGVHALGQVANFHLPESGPREDTEYPGEWPPCPEEVMAYLNRYLPEDIAVIGIQTVPERFHSRLNAVRKIYLYQIETGPKRNVFSRRRQYGLGKRLDLEAMRAAAALLCGTHDYRSFCGNKKMKKSTVRTIESITVRQEAEGGLVSLVFVGNGFLQHMVRILCGTLIEVGLGERPPEQMTEILQARDRQKAGFLAPAEGLTLVAVQYPEDGK